MNEFVSESCGVEIDEKEATLMNHKNNYCFLRGNVILCNINTN